MNKYNEIFRLKKMLEKENISFVYTDRTIDDFMRYQIVVYKRNDPNNRLVSVVEGIGTYGNKLDLLEIMGLLTPEEKQSDSVVGYLTAEEVFRRIKENY